MHEVMRKRLLRKLETLPEERLYQVLDYIEFLESKYALAPTAPPGGFQKAAERFEDRLRARSLAPRAIGGTMRLVGAAGRMLDTLGEVGRTLVEPLRTPQPQRPVDGAVGGTTAARPAAPQTPAGTAPAEAGPAEPPFVPVSGRPEAG